MLIDAETLNKRLHEPNLIIIDCRFALPGPDFDPDLGQTLYEQGHIPHSLYADLERDLSGKITVHTGRHPLPDSDIFITKVQSWGIEPDKTVVVYDDKGGMLAARLWWMLRHWLGHNKTLVLDGGYPAWLNQHFPCETDTRSPEPSSHRYSIYGEAIVETPWVKSQLNNPDVQLYDARAHPRYLGQDETIDPIAGHIPGAVSAPCIENLQDGVFKSPEELRERFSRLLRGQPYQAIHSCGSGVTACHNILAMDIAGLYGARLYAGSWSEWIRDPDNPITTGDES